MSRVCRIEADGSLPVVEQPGAGAFWLDFGGDPQGWQAWLDEAGAPTSVLHAAARAGHHLQFLSRPGWVYVGAPLRSRDPDDPMIFFSAALTADRLATWHDEPEAGIAEGLTTLVEDDRIVCSSPLRVVIGILFLALDETIESTRLLRHEIGEVADLLDEDPGEVSVERIRLLRRRSGRMAALCEDQLQALASLDGLELEKLDADPPRRELRRQLDAHRHLPPAVERLQDRASELHQAFQLNLQERSESRLRLISIISAIFLPLTLVAGVYGMNFEHMPELKYQAAYFICLGAMGTLAVGMLVAFWRKGWFD
jgi:magnesium transporter